MALKLSNTTQKVQSLGTNVPVYDRQYMTLHTLQEREMRARVESERAIRDDMTHLQEGLARVCNQIQEVASDLKGNLPRLYQETKELRRETQQLTMAYHQNTAETAKLSENFSDFQREAVERFLSLETHFSDFQTADRSEKNDMWSKLCSKQVVSDLSDRVFNYSFTS